MDLKQAAANQAVKLISDKSIIGLGAGSTIAFLVEALQKRIVEGLQVQFVTSSFTTLQLLQKHGFFVNSTAAVKEMDFYFDGCDQMDKQLNALKSGGGIHTQEKLLASMAKQFILIGDEAKLVNGFNTKYPLVLEILPQAASFVPHKLEQLFPDSKTVMRINDKKDGPVFTENGNYLLDFYFQQWPELSGINPTLKLVSGIVETSLFYNLASAAIVAGEKGVVTLHKSS